MSRLPSEVHLVGSHGSEIDAGFGIRAIPRRRASTYYVIGTSLETIVADFPVARLEQNPRRLRCMFASPKTTLRSAELPVPRTWPVRRRRFRRSRHQTR